MQAKTPTHPAPGEVHVWSLDLDRSPGESHVLSAEELERAHRLLRPEHQVRYMNAHVALRRLLGGYLKVTPESLRFENGAAGKPALVSGPVPLSFNLSHSEEFGLIAVTAGARVGIDIEVERPMNDLEDVAAQIMTDAESQEFNAIAKHLQLPAFFDLWTRKESILKAVGGGFLLEPRSFELGMAHVQTRVTADDSTWTVTPLTQPAGKSAAVAVEGSTAKISTFLYKSAAE